MLPEVRMTRIVDAIGLHRKSKLSCIEAAALLGISERHFRRLRDAYEAQGADGIIDRRRGRASGRIEAANLWLAQIYVAQHNARFAVDAAEEGSAFVPFLGPLEDILCVQEERVVGNDNTVRYEGRVLQIPEQRHRRHYVKVRARVHAYPDGRLALFHGPRRLADYDGAGSLIEPPRQARHAA